LQWAQQHQRWSTSARRLWWLLQAIPPNPYVVLTEVYPTMIEACEDNR
jgi:hypothetical protein